MSSDSRTNARIAFLHGRPGPHPTHAALARSVNADFFFVDRILRYHDLEDSGKIRRYTSWLLNSLLFKNARGYDLILSEGMHVTPVLMKKLRMLGPSQKTVAMLGNEFLFLLKSKFYSPSTQKVLMYTMRQYDALLCMCEFQAELAREILKDSKEGPQILIAHEIISNGRPKPQGSSTPPRNGHKLLFVAHGPSGWRGFYKGIETLFATFKLVVQKYPEATLTVIGEWDSDYVEGLISKTGAPRERIEFLGSVSDLLTHFDASTLCVHITNGDAFPVATLEAMRAGLPTIVSDLTGTKEVARKIDDRLVVPMDADVAAERIDWYFQLPEADKQQLSDKGRSVMMEYTAERGIAEFRTAIDQVLNK